MKMKTANARATELGKELFRLKRQREKLTEQLKTVNENIEKLATDKLIKLMETTDLEKFTIRGYGTIYVKDEFFANVKKEDRPKVYEWLRKTGNDSLIQDWVFPSTLKAFVREQFTQGQPLPDFIKVQFVPTANTMTTGKKQTDEEEG